MSPASKAVFGEGPFVKHAVTVVLVGTPGDVITALVITPGAAAVPHGFVTGVGVGHCVVSAGRKLATGVTTATLAPCLTAFLREFFVNHARANSVINNRMANINKSISAVSINV